MFFMFALLGTRIGDFGDFVFCVGCLVNLVCRAAGFH